MKTLLIAAMASLCTVASAADYTIDPAHTYPNFAVDHLGFSTMYGRFNTTSGKLSMDLEQGTGAVEIVIETASIDTGHEKRDEHLRSPDFLNVVEFPEMRYRSTSVTFHEDQRATVEGELTLLGVTRPVTLEVARISCGVHPFNKSNVCGFDAAATLKRSDFGMSYGIPAIGDELQLMLEVEAVRD